MIYKFNRHGFTELGESDEDFNGSFETEIYYEHENAQGLKPDTTSDGFKDYREKYKHGKLETVSYYDASTNKIFRAEKFWPLKLISAEMDTNRDGAFDTAYEYDSIGVIKSKATR